MSEPILPAGEIAAAHAQTRLLWIAIAAVLAFGIVATASFGYPALILVALGLTFGVFALLLMLMRG